MIEQPLTRRDLRKFFDVQSATPGDDRPLNNVLRALDIRLRGGTTRWPVIWAALGLSAQQDPQHFTALTAPLLTAQAVADLIGVQDPSIIYRWSKGQLPQGAALFPEKIDLSNGRKNARARRWRQAEVLAWHCGDPHPQYVKPAPVIGALTPAK